MTLIGNQRIQKYLAAVLLGDRIAHAYLFYGPAHAGKTAFAELLVKGILCERRKLEGCGACASCAAFSRSPGITCVLPGVPFIPEEDGEDISIKEIRGNRCRVPFTY